MLAHATPIEVSSEASGRAIGKSASFLLESRNAPLELAQARNAALAGGFSPVQLVEPDFGFRAGAIWLRVPVSNSSSQPVDRVLRMGTNFLTELDIWLEAADTTHVAAQEPDSRFVSRPLPVFELAIPLSLPPGASTLWIRYRSEGSTALPLALETHASFAGFVQSAAARHFTYYGVMLLFVAAAIIAFAILPRALFLVYGAYALFLLLFLMQRDGHAFQLLWPDAPRWNGLAALPLGAAVGMAAAQFARLYLDTRAWSPVADRQLRLLILSGALLVVAALLVPSAPLKLAGLGLSWLGALLFVILGIARMRDGGWRYGFFVAGWAGILLASSLVAGASLLELPLPRALSLDIIRFASVFDASMMALAIGAGIVALRRERDRMMDERLAMVQRNAELMGRLARLEDRHALTAALAERRGRILADTSHDLRQPILALKAALGQAGSGAPPRHGETVEESLRYLERLVEEGLAQALGPVAEADTVEPVIVGSPEVLEAGLLLSTLVAVHAGEAASAGIGLRMVGSRRQVLVEPLSTLRILGNLLGNAIRHANSRVVVGARLAGGRLAIEIHDDGPGLGGFDQRALAERGRRGPAAARNHPAGRGLGLAIVAEIAAANGLEWSLADRRNGGAVARLMLPLADVRCSPAMLSAALRP